MEWLKSNGIKTYMVTADNDLTAKAVADKCGVERYCSLASSDGKAEFIEEIKKSGYTAYVGDDEICQKAADFAVTVDRSEELSYLKGDSLFTFAKALTNAKQINKTLSVRFVLGLLLNLVLIVLMMFGVINQNAVWIVALVQTVAAVVPEIMAKNICFEKKTENSEVADK